MEQTPEDLKGHFFERVESASADDSELAYDVWLLLIADSWYQQQLDHCARSVARKAGGKSQDVDDLKQQAILVLHQKLQRNPTLNFDTHRARESLDAWMRKIIYNTCCDAGLSVFDYTKLIDEQESEQTRRPAPISDTHTSINIERALSQLPKRQRTAIMLRRDGKSILEVAQRLHLTIDQVRYALKQAQRTLHRTISCLNDVNSSGEQTVVPPG